MNADFIKSAAAGLIGAVIIALNHKLGLELNPAEIAAISAIVISFIGKEVLNNRAPDSPAPTKPADAPALDVKKVTDAVAAAFTPKAPVLLALVLGAALLSATPASAQQLSLGPAAPLMAITPGDPHPVAFAPGTGFQVACDVFATKLNGHDAFWLSPGFALLGTAQSNGTTSALGVSAALFVAILGLVDIGIGSPLFDSLGNGLFQHPDKRTPMILFGLDHGLMAFLGGFGIGHPTPPTPALPPVPTDGDHPNGP